MGRRLLGWRREQQQQVQLERSPGGGRILNHSVGVFEDPDPKPKTNHDNGKKNVRDLRQTDRRGRLLEIVQTPVQEVVAREAREARAAKTGAEGDTEYIRIPGTCLDDTPN